MNDNILRAADMRLMGVEEPMTPEGALFQNQLPFLTCGSDMDNVVFMRIVLAVAREYVKDYDLMHAVARAGQSWEVCRYLERDPVFIGAVRAIQEELTPDEIITRTELFNLLKREATTAAKASDRIAALKELSRIAGFAPEDKSTNSGVPVINITLNGATERPVLNVTPAKAALPSPRKGEELL